MNTPSSGKARIFTSLRDALAAYRIPEENHMLIRRFCEHLGIVDYEERAGYIKAVRPNSGPALQINFGWTNGFRSEEEAHAAAGADAKVWPSDRATGLWGVTHPLNAIGHGGGGPEKAAPDYGTCPNCFLTLPATGACDNCA